MEQTDTTHPPAPAPESSASKTTEPSTSAVNPTLTTQPEPSTDPLDPDSIPDYKGPPFSYYVNKYNVPTHDANGKPLSKKAQKRAVKDARWEELREVRKEARKLKKIADRERYKERVRNGTLPKKPPRRRKQVETNVTVAIDLQFQHLMNTKEIKSTAQQLSYCYSQNNKSNKRLKFAITNFGGPVKDALAVAYPSHLNWKLQAFRTPYFEAFKPEDVVYLSADAEETLTDLQDAKVYMIGGIVDKNRYPGLCQEDAVKHQCKTAKLPIADHIDMKGSRKVLTTNHVFEILSKYMDTKDWKKSIYDVIPARKGVVYLDDKDAKQEAEEGQAGGAAEGGEAHPEEDDGVASQDEEPVEGWAEISEHGDEDGEEMDEEEDGGEEGERKRKRGVEGDEDDVNLNRAKEEPNESGGERKREVEFDEDNASGKRVKVEVTEGVKVKEEVNGKRKREEGGDEEDLGGKRVKEEGGASEEGVVA
ncbi:tRNA methyltransferase 10 [Rhizophlyctis rosea]|uniref:tRNA (guanine(9)-N1)-methyltransferase n=1 Tax=Rhizophlyctis rosea TaxID=64517 RepID=A0AAD5S9I7_9FUNG|nr:tRNA methyltransferase 10 [Rhizophlyctis rosea]